MDVLSQLQLSEHTLADMGRVYTLVTAALRNHYSERGVRIWWRTRRSRLAMLTPAELLELGCYQTVFFEASRTTGSLPTTADGSQISQELRDTGRAPSRDVTIT